jgi:glycosyltransferase involved in cell wall biosynthesis
MRLAIVASHPIQYQAPLFRALAQRVDLDVFFAHRASARDQANAGYGVDFEWDVDLLSGYHHSFLTNVSKTPCLDRFSGCDTPEIGARIAAGRFDAVLVMGWYLKSWWQAGFAAKRRRIPLLVRGDSQLQTPRSRIRMLAKRILYPPTLRLFNAVLYVGKRSREYYEYYGYPAERLFFSPHCVDTAWFAERAGPAVREALRAKLAIGADAAVVLFAGRLVDFKRPHDVVAACAELALRGRHVALLIAGAGPLEEEIRRKAASHGVTLHMLGFQNQSEMPAVYAAADVLVLPSSGHETWGLVANEALACGTPIAVSNAVGCAPDLAGDGTAGRVFPLGDSASLADSLESLIANPPAAATIGRKSAEYGLDAACHGIVQALNFFASGGKPALRKK